MSGSLLNGFAVWVTMDDSTYVCKGHANTDNSGPETQRIYYHAVDRMKARI